MRPTHYAIILIISFGLSWAAMQWLSPPTKSTTVTQDNHPDGYMRDVIFKYYDQNGNLDNQIKSPMVTHYPQGDKMIIQSPQMTYFNPKEDNDESNA